MAILVVSLGNFIVGSIMGPSDIDEVAKGFVGYNCKSHVGSHLFVFNLSIFPIFCESGELVTTNLLPDYRVFNGFKQNFFSVFAVFFPAATGILAGANISGDLKV